jgi:hypothetical protein
MQYITRPQAIRNVVASLFGAALLVGVVPAVASAACASDTESLAFAQFGDTAHYMLAPGGSFESGAPGWTLSKAAVVSGNERYNLVRGSHSLAIEPNGTAVSPLVCVSSEYPSFRFVARQLSGGKDAALNVSVRWVNALGLTVNSRAGTVQSGSSWEPSAVMKLDESLPVGGQAAGLLTLQVALAFQPSGGSFAIDDVYIDPYRR